jgi:hypothetical protein
MLGVYQEFVFMCVYVCGSSSSSSSSCFNSQVSQNVKANRIGPYSSVIRRSRCVFSPKVLMEVDDGISRIVGNPQGI